MMMMFMETKARRGDGEWRMETKLRRLGRLLSLAPAKKKKRASISSIMVSVIAPAPRLTTCLHMPLSDDTAMLTCMVVAVAYSCGSSQTLLTSSRSWTPSR